MKRPACGILAIVLLAVGAGLVWFGLRPSEPVYDGRPISYWIDRPRVFEIGGERFGIGLGSTNFLNLDGRAVPFLAEALERRESFSHKAYAHLHNRLPLSIRRRLPIPKNSNYLLIQEGAIATLGRMGPEARPAIPSIIRILDSSEEGVVRGLFKCVAAGILGRIGKNDPASIKALKQALNSRTAAVRESAATALSLDSSNYFRRRLGDEF
jgi:hypothetical protein